MGASGREELRFDRTNLPLESLADWSAAETAAAKIVDLATERARRRPTAPIAER